MIAQIPREQLCSLSEETDWATTVSIAHERENEKNLVLWVLSFFGACKQAAPHIFDIGLAKHM